jgi:hypothetical protein
VVIALDFLRALKRSADQVGIHSHMDLGEEKEKGGGVGGGGGGGALWCQLICFATKSNS